MATGTIKKNMILLWENSSPTSPFVAQTVSINLADYQFVMIGFRSWYNDPAISYEIFKIGEDAFHLELRNANSSYTTAVFQRSLTVSSSGVRFGDNVGKASILSDAVSTSNAGLIPVAVYGIKC